MEGAILGCPIWWMPWLPQGVRRVRRGRELLRHRWDVLALTESGCQALRRKAERQPIIDCALLLLPGDCSPADIASVRSVSAITYGLSLRDSVTLSSLREPVLCVQRELPRPDGGAVEPQEIPLRFLPGPPERILPLLGLRLLCL